VPGEVKVEGEVKEEAVVVVVGEEVVGLADTSSTATFRPAKVRIALMPEIQAARISGEPSRLSCR
jgi:hypothetical protein